jgi:hypothetical protein
MRNSAIIKWRHWIGSIQSPCVSANNTREETGPPVPGQTARGTTSSHTRTTKPAGVCFVPKGEVTFAIIRSGAARFASRPDTLRVCVKKSSWTDSPLVPEFGSNHLFSGGMDGMRWHRWAAQCSSWHVEDTCDRNRQLPGWRFLPKMPVGAGDRRLEQFTVSVAFFGFALR